MQILDARQIELGKKKKKLSVKWHELDIFV